MPCRIETLHPTPSKSLPAIVAFYHQHDSDMLSLRALEVYRAAVEAHGAVGIYDENGAQIGAGFTFQHHGTATIEFGGARIVKPHWGLQKVMLQYRILRAHLYAHGEFEKAFAFVYARNTSSIKTMEALGFENKMPSDAFLNQISFKAKNQLNNGDVLYFELGADDFAAEAKSSYLALKAIRDAGNLEKDGQFLPFAIRDPIFDSPIFADGRRELEAG